MKRAFCILLFLISVDVTAYDMLFYEVLCSPYYIEISRHWERRADPLTADEIAKFAEKSLHPALEGFEKECEIEGVGMMKIKLSDRPAIFSIYVNDQLKISEINMVADNFYHQYNGKRRSATIEIDLIKVSWAMWGLQGKVKLESEAERPLHTAKILLEDKFEISRSWEDPVVVSREYLVDKYLR
ncbi:hypothetical protein [Teredinibacter turnerae]|uniref:hypothetical protein n=1 Tax=Teredinibacter turnerae TaxID=2426 RepID=UPI0030D20445